MWEGHVFLSPSKGVLLFLKREGRGAPREKKEDI